MWIDTKIISVMEVDSSDSLKKVGVLKLNCELCCFSNHEAGVLGGNFTVLVVLVLFLPCLKSKITTNFAEKGITLYFVSV